GRLETERRPGSERKVSEGNPGTGAETYRRATSPRQPPTLHGAFYRSKLRFLAWRINEHIVRWAMQKYKRFRRHAARAFTWLVRVHQHQPALFAHWQLAPPLRGRPMGAG